MVSEFINNRVDVAHALIDDREFDRAVNLLKRLKTRIHDDEVLTRVKNWEKNHDDELNKRMNEIDESSKHEVDKGAEKLNQIVRYADAYLSFYHQLTQEYDL